MFRESQQVLLSFILTLHNSTMPNLKEYDVILKIVGLIAPIRSSLDQGMVDQINAILNVLRQSPENETPSRNLPSSPMADDNGEQEGYNPSVQHGDINSPASYHSLSPPGSPSLNSYIPFITAPCNDDSFLQRSPSAEMLSEANIEGDVTNEIQYVLRKFQLKSCQHQQA